MHGYVYKVSACTPLRILKEGGGKPVYKFDYKYRWTIN
jgi:hypothetical protein